VSPLVVAETCWIFHNSEYRLLIAMERDLLPAVGISRLRCAFRRSRFLVVSRIRVIQKGARSTYQQTCR